MESAVSPASAKSRFSLLNSKYMGNHKIKCEISLLRLSEDRYLLATNKLRDNVYNDHPQAFISTKDAKAIIDYFKLKPEPTKSGHTWYVK